MAKFLQIRIKYYVFVPTCILVVAALMIGLYGLYWWLPMPLGFRPVEFTFDPKEQSALAEQLPVQAQWQSTSYGLSYRMRTTSTHHQADELIEVSVEVMNVSSETVTYYSSGHGPFNGSTFHYVFNDQYTPIKFDHNFSGVIYGGYTIMAPNARVIVGNCKIQLPDEPGRYDMYGYTFNEEGHARRLPGIWIEVE